MILTKAKPPKLIKKAELVKQTDLTVSLVICDHDLDLVERTLQSLFNTPLNIDLCIIDNSSAPRLLNLLQKYPETKYKFNNGKDLGFSRSHNYAFTCLSISKYHLILSPYLNFSSNVIPELISCLNNNPEVGLVSPKTFYPDGTIQYSCKREPNIISSIIENLVPNFLKSLFKAHLDKVEMKDEDTYSNTVKEVPTIKKHFLLFNKEAFYEIGGFDENIQNSFEDSDICMRMSNKYRIVFYPHVHIHTHWHQKPNGSIGEIISKIQSIFYFFNKHGWKWI